MLSWMVWTTPVAVFFSCVALLLAVMTVWELRSPTVLRNFASRGAMDIEGLGERMASWFGLPEEPSTWIGAAISAVVLVVIMARG